MSLIEDTDGAGRAPARNGVARKKQPAVMRALRGVGQPVSATPPFKMPRLKAPVFPKLVISIETRGAIPGGESDCTDAIAKAIDTCAKQGGGRVLVPAGTWLTGPIHLQSNIDLHLAEGATLKFSADPKHYLPPVFVRWGGCECYNYSPLIYARDCRNIAVTGKGSLAGQGQSWWHWQPAEHGTRAKLYEQILADVPVERRRFGTPEMPLRPQFILPINCTNVLLEDFTIAEGGPFWTVHVAYCENVIARRLHINAPDGPNNDGIVIDSSRNVLIEDCDIRSGEDCIALKSGMNEDGLRVGRPTENVIIRRIRASKGTGGFAIGSDMSGGVRNVLVHDCDYDGLSAGIRLKAARGRGGIVEDIFVTDIRMRQIPGEAIQLTSEYASFARVDGRAPTFRNIRISNVTCEQAKTAARMIGLHDSALRNIHLENVTINSDEGLYCASGNAIHLRNVRIKPRMGPVLAVKDSQEVIIHGLNAAQSGGVFLDLRGRQTRNIRLRGEPTDSTTLRPAVVLGIDVPRDALVHE